MNPLDALPLWLIAASLALNAVFLRSLLTKLNTVYDAVVGTTGRPGLCARIESIEHHLWPERPFEAPYAPQERRHMRRRASDRREQGREPDRGD